MFFFSSRDTPRALRGHYNKFFKVHLEQSIQDGFCVGLCVKPYRSSKRTPLFYVGPCEWRALLQKMAVAQNRELKLDKGVDG